MLLLLLGMSRLVVTGTVWRDYADMQYNTAKSILSKKDNLVQLQ